LERKEELLEGMKKVKEQEGFFGVVVLITDIMKEGSTMLVVANELEPFEKAFNVKFENGQVWLAGVMSRKKQVVPPLERIFLD
jgi:manganese-dependent inorganic pyrophosphatase